MDSSTRITDEDARKTSIHVTEVIDKDYSRAMSPEIHEAKMKEVRDLLHRGTICVTLKEELRDGANALTVRFVLAIKSNVGGEIKCKARYVIGGHRDKLKHFMVHGARCTNSPSIFFKAFARSCINALLLGVDF